MPRNTNRSNHDGLTGRGDLDKRLSRLPAMACLLVLLVGTSLGAQATELVLRHGRDGDNYDTNGIAFRFGPRWSRDHGHWHATLRPEVEINHIDYTGQAPGPRTLTQLGGNGQFRLYYGGGSIRPYAEIGLGLSYFSNGSLGAKEFSTRYQFSEFLGLGGEFGGKWFAGWRYSHYSNADIKKPNDGLDLQQIVIGVRF